MSAQERPDDGKAADAAGLRSMRIRLFAWSMLISVGVGTLFPRMAYRLRWRSRHGGRGVLLSIATNVLVTFVFLTRVRPRLLRWAADAKADYERVRAELRAEFGRDATPEEIHARRILTTE